MKKYKIVLISVYHNSAQILLEEMGVCFLTSYLRKHGYEVLLLCAREEQVDYQKIVDFQPDMIGVTVYYYTKQAVYDFCKKVRSRLPGVLICAGGYLPTYYGMKMMGEAPFIDFIIRGEGEISFLNLIERLERGEALDQVKGLTFRRHGEIIVNEDQLLIEDLDSLPWQARDILRDNQLKIASISTSRGCARRCSFCNTTNFWKRWRGRGVDKILAEIESLYEMGVRYFAFNDSSFEDSHTQADYERLISLVQGIVDLDLDISYIAGFRAEFSRRATPELMALLKKSGLRQVRIGIETGNDADRKLFGKFASVEDNGRIIELFQEHRIYPRVGFINFNPYSTFSSLRQNVDFLERYGWAANFHVLLSRLNLFKGTRLYDRVRDDGLMTGAAESDSPGYTFVEKRLGPLVSSVQGYLYLLHTETGGAPGKICNFKNYFKSVVYDYSEKFGETGDRAARLVLDFEKEVDAILAEINARNARWFRELLQLAEHGWENREAYRITQDHLNKEYLMDTADRLAQEKTRFAEAFCSLGPQYESWSAATWDLIEKLNF